MISNEEFADSAEFLQPYIDVLLELRASRLFDGFMEYLDARSCGIVRIPDGLQRHDFVRHVGRGDLVKDVRADIVFAQELMNMKAEHDRDSE